MIGRNFILRNTFLAGGLQIFVRTVDGVTYTLDVLHEETILQVKEKIGLKVRKPAASLELLHGNTRLENQRTLQDYQIMAETILSVIYKIAQTSLIISLQNGRQVTIQVASNASVGDTRAAVREKARVSDDFVLLHDGVALDDEERRLDELEIGNQAIVHVILAVPGGNYS